MKNILKNILNLVDSLIDKVIEVRLRDCKTAIGITLVDIIKKSGYLSVIRSFKNVDNIVVEREEGCVKVILGVKVEEFLDSINLKIIINAIRIDVSCSMNGEVWSCYVNHDDCSLVKRVLKENIRTVRYLIIKSLEEAILRAI